MAQYGCTNVTSPVTVGSGDRWLLLNKGILMRGVGVEDMSRTPAHVLLQPLRLPPSQRRHLPLPRPR